MYFYFFYVLQATILTLYAHEVIQIYGLYPAEIEHHQYDLSSVRTVKVPASRILPVYKRYLAELMPNLTQFNNVTKNHLYSVQNFLHKALIITVLFLFIELLEKKQVYAQTETMVLTALPSALSPSRADFLLFLKGFYQ